MAATKLTKRQAETLDLLKKAGGVTLTGATASCLWRNYRALVEKGCATETEIKPGISRFEPRGGKGADEG